MNQAESKILRVREGEYQMKPANVKVIVSEHKQ